MIQPAKKAEVLRILTEARVHGSAAMIELNAARKKRNPFDRPAKPSQKKTMGESR